ncbi:MAG: MFS transporter, partial [Alphaproteobacteria bacterium]
HFYAMMMVGFLSAIMAQRFVYRQAELKSEVVSGLILIGAALLMMLTRSQAVVGYIAPLFVGFGLGIIGSRFLLFFIKLSRHCQRGTSQSTFILGWESGLAVGIGVGYAAFQQESAPVLVTSLILVVLALAMYQFTHKWFLTHKNR